MLNCDYNMNIVTIKSTIFYQPSQKNKRIFYRLIKTIKRLINFAKLNCNNDLLMY